MSHTLRYLDSGRIQAARDAIAFMCVHTCAFTTCMHEAYLVVYLVGVSDFQGCEARRSEAARFCLNTPCLAVAFVLEVMLKPWFTRACVRVCTPKHGE